MIVPDFDQRRRWQIAVYDQFFRIGKGDHIIGPAVQDHRVRPDGLGCSPVLPCWAEQNEFGIAAVDVHRQGTATG